MDYRIEIFDTWGQCIAAYDDVPLLDVIRSSPDQADVIRGLLPASTRQLSHAFKVRVMLEEQFICEGLVESTRPEWSDTRKLILDQYVTFHEIIAFEAKSPPRQGNTAVARAYANREISVIVKDVINSASGPIHYTVSHLAYPDGAQREFVKFEGRKTAGNELEVGGIDTGQWVGGARIDYSSAYAKDGDTIAGLVVDGVAWPDVRLMMIDCEETSRNSHAISRHPEVAQWTDAEYDASPYKRQADKAKALLQSLIDAKGIDYIELNPHKNVLGAYDDRVDVYGRYIGLIFGGGECFNAALVEQDLADVYLYEDGKYHVPDMALKEFFSYRGVYEDSIEATEISLTNFDVKGGVLEVLTALAYAADGYGFSVTPDLAVTFRALQQPDRVIFFDPVRTGMRLGAHTEGLVNHLVLEGHPLSCPSAGSFSRGESIENYGLNTETFAYFSLARDSDAALLAHGLLNDLAYPAPTGAVTFYRGNADLAVGEVIELRDGPIRRLEEELPNEWGGAFQGKLVGRIAKVQHRLTGRQVSTTVWLTSPLRSVQNPLHFITRRQESAHTLFGFRLDDPTVGLDMGFHLD